MLGFRYPGNKTPTGQPFEGSTGTESNPDATGRRSECSASNRTRRTRTSCPAPIRARVAVELASRREPPSIAIPILQSLAGHYV